MSPEALPEASPFLIAYIIQFLEMGIKSLAGNTLKLILADGEALSGRPREIAIELAVSVYRQFSFIISLVLSGVSALALITETSRPLFAEFCVCFIFIVILIWVMRWQPLAGGSDPTMRKSSETQMRIATMLSTTVLLVLTLYVKGTTPPREVQLHVAPSAAHSVTDPQKVDK